MSYVGMAANVVGGIMQSIAASQENRAMQQAFQQELQQQLGYSRQEYGQFLGDLPKQGSEAASKAIDSGAKNTEAAYGQINSMPLLANGGDSSAYASTDKAALQQSGAARSRIGGMSDWQLGRMIDNIKLQNALNRISFRSQGQAQVFPYKMYAAQHSQDELDFWGKAISSIGGGGGGSPLSTSSAPSGGYSGPAPTGQQMAALNQGYGPVNASYAQGLYTPQNMNLGSTTQLLPATGF